MGKEFRMLEGKAWAGESAYIFPSLEENQINQCKYPLKIQI